MGLIDKSPALAIAREHKLPIVLHEDTAGFVPPELLEKLTVRIENTDQPESLEQTIDKVTKFRQAGINVELLLDVEHAAMDFGATENVAEALEQAVETINKADISVGGIHFCGPMVGERGHQFLRDNEEAREMLKLVFALARMWNVVPVFEPKPPIRDLIFDIIFGQPTKCVRSMIVQSAQVMQSVASKVRTEPSLT